MASNYKNYAQALFELAMEENNLDGFFEQIMEIKDLLGKNKDYFKIFASPALGEDEKIALIDEAFSCVIPTIKKFLKLLSSRSALSAFLYCADDFAELYYKEKGIILAHVRSAVPLSEDERDKILKKLSEKTAKKVELKCEVDESLIGGLVLSYDGKEFDGSLKAKLSSFKKSFT